jgi:hypothetical protein
MSYSRSTAPADPGKTANSHTPAKPHPEFLLPHAAGVWARKIRGKLYYLGPWNDPDGALAKYLEQKDALRAGRTPRPDTDALTVKELRNQFLVAKLVLVESRELTHRSWVDYKAGCDQIVSHFGKGWLVADLGSDDFALQRKKMAERWGPVTLGNVIQRMGVAFSFATDDDLIDRPVHCGSSFKGPARKVIRIDRDRKGPKPFTADEIRRLIDAAGPDNEGDDPAGHQRRHPKGPTAGTCPRPPWT